MKLIPIKEFNWGEVGPSYELTCINHQTAVYYSKNPWLRNLHFSRGAEDIGPFTECPCPFSDLVVKVEEDCTSQT
jgi:hypothetical protein